MEPVKLLKSCSGVTKVDHETIDRGQCIFKCQLELNLDENYQSIINSTITKCLIEEQSETEEKKAHMDTIEAKFNKEFSLALVRHFPGRVGFRMQKGLGKGKLRVLPKNWLRLTP